MLWCGVGGGGGEVSGKKTLRGVDGGLSLLFRDVDVQAEIEVQDDDGGCAGTAGSHLAEALELAKLALERSRDRGGDDVGAGAWIESENLNCGIVDLRKSGDGQLRVADDSDEQNGGHQEGRCDRSEDA